MSTPTQSFCPKGTIVSFATVLSPAVFTPLAEVGNIKLTGSKQESDDATNMDSAGFREYIPTIKDGGEYEFSGNLITGDTSRAALKAIYDAGDTVNWKVQLPNSHGNWTFKAFVSEYGNYDLPVDKKATTTFKVKVTGAVTESFGS